MYPTPILPLTALDLSATAQATLQRRPTDPDAVDRYRARYVSDGPDSLPPVRVVRDGATYHLVDGWHRARAAQSAGLEALPAIIVPGDARFALLEALAANLGHGVPVPLEQRRENARTLLADETWRTWSDARIAAHVQISPQLVAKLRAEVPGAQVEQRVGADGRTCARGTGRATAKAEPAIHLTVGAATVPTVDRLTMALAITAWGSGLDHTKLSILAALWLAGAPVDRDTLAALIDAVPSVHPGQLRRKGLIHGDKAGYHLTPEGEVLLRGIPWEDTAGLRRRLTEPGHLGTPIPTLPEPETLGPADLAPVPAAAAPAHPTARDLLADAILGDPRAPHRSTSPCSHPEWCLLALMVGIDTAEGLHWDDHSRASAPAQLDEHLARNLAAAVRRDDPRLPDLITLARLWGLDPDALQVQEGAA